jgi:hypothetical protein
MEMAREDKSWGKLNRQIRGRCTSISEYCSTGGMNSYWDYKDLWRPFWLFVRGITITQPCAALRTVATARHPSFSVIRNVARGARNITFRRNTTIIRAHSPPVQKANFDFINHASQTLINAPRHSAPQYPYRTKMNPWFGDRFIIIVK